MKARFRKRNNIWVTLLILLSLAILLSAGIFTSSLATMMFIVWISFTIAVLNDYEINDKDRLKGFLTRINIHKIHKVIILPKGVEVHYYKKPDNSVRIRHMRPKDVQAFVAKLKEINPNIQII